MIVLKIIATLFGLVAVIVVISLCSISGKCSEIERQNGWGE